MPEILGKQEKLSRNFFDIYAFLKEIENKEVVVSLFQQTLPVSLIKNIDWDSLYEEDTESFDFRGMVYHCKINNKPVYLMVALLYKIINYPQLTAIMIKRSLDWILLKSDEGAPKLPVVIPIALYCGEGFCDLKPYPLNKNFLECFESPSIAEKYGMVKGDLPVIDLTTLSYEIWYKIMHQVGKDRAGRIEAKKISKRILKYRYNFQFVKRVSGLSTEEILEVVSNLKEEKISKERMLEIAEDLLENGIDKQIVKDNTGISEVELSCLSK